MTIITYFPRLINVQTGSGAHPVSYSMANGSPFSEGGAAVAQSLQLTSISCQSQELVEIHFNSPYMPSKQALRTTLPFTFYPEQATVTRLLIQFLVYTKSKVHHHYHKSHQTLPSIDLNSLHQNLSYHTSLCQKAAQLAHNITMLSVCPPLSPLNLVYRLSHNCILT